MKQKKTHICGVPDDFVLQFLPTFHASLDKNLRTKTETLRGQVTKFIGVVRETRTKTTKCESRTQDNRVTDLLGSSKRVVDSRNCC